MQAVGFLTVFGALIATPALSSTVEVKMLNKGSTSGFMVFEPAFVKIAPGDSVTFVPVDKGHDVTSLPAIAPGGAQPFAGKINQPLTVRFTTEGLYGYKCTPHLGMGMVGLVQVGKAGDKTAALAGAEKLPGLAKTRLTGLISAVR